MLSKRLLLWLILPFWSLSSFATTNAQQLEKLSSGVSNDAVDERPHATTEVIAPWPPATAAHARVQDLHNEYYNIFRYGNRNAASHRWSTFLLERAPQMTWERLEMFFAAFCAVSGSPVRPSDYNRYRLTLPKVGGGHATGYMHYCCWPCVCDTQDFIRVDTRNVTTVQGHVKQQQFAVIGNPCQHPEKLHDSFVQPFGRGKTTLAQTAQEVRCLPGGILDGATLSDHGHVIIGMLFDADTEPGTGVVPSALDALSHPVPGRISTSHSTGVLFQDGREWQGKCEDRALHGYNSGMGEIFRQVCAIAPIPPEALQPPLAFEDGLTMNSDDSKNDSCRPDLGNNVEDDFKDQLDNDATLSREMES